MVPAGHAVVHLFSHPVAVAPIGTSLLVEGAPRIGGRQASRSMSLDMPGGGGRAAKKKKKADPAEEANVKKVTEKWAGGRKRSHQWRPGLSGFQPLPEGDTFKTRARKGLGAPHRCSAPSQLRDCMKVIFPLGAS